MAEQDFVPITPGTGASIEAADLGGPAGGGPYRQRMEVADMAVSIKNVLQLLQSLGLAQDPATGRLRFILEAISASQVVSGFGINGVLTTDSSYMPRDISQLCWAQSVRPCIT